MSDINEQDDYSYDEDSAVKADAAASRINEGGGYIGTFASAEAVTAQSGTKGIAFKFQQKGGGDASFTLWTKKENGESAFGKSFVDSMLFHFGLKTIKAGRGLVEQWVDTDKGREKQEVEGTVYPDLCNKLIGVVLEKELTSKKNGSDSFRFNLVGLYGPDTKLMMSEIKERKSTPVKLDRLLKGLKVKDSRKAAANEPGQPSIGGVESGDY